jgi:hypothetical protein
MISPLVDCAKLVPKRTTLAISVIVFMA